ncbi:MAG: putative metallo-hydrolase YycJ [Candidatus Dichloromethanomonas elyunquensis]|nr:MAG: putative metallo-hydrolase YycJ [Candidatus Dichloromethanomonas elyunquensis]
MHLATLASGSSGNAILIGEENRNLLVDCGITVKRLLANLSMVNTSPLQIEGIIITHEHMDHIKGVGALARKLNIPVYATQGLWDVMEGILGYLKPEQQIRVQKDICLAGMKIRLIPTSHDSKESYGLKVTGKSLTLGIATDSGMITEEMHRNLQGCDAYVVEANHDLQKLMHGKYPWYLKKRISSNYGHLSNVQLAEALCEWLMENSQKVVLAHLSEENNTPELALSTVLGILRKSQARNRFERVKIRVAPRHYPDELIVLRE